jgi:hypothetical protein
MSETVRKEEQSNIGNGTRELNVVIEGKSKDVTSSKRSNVETHLQRCRVQEIFSGHGRGLRV